MRRNRARAVFASILLVLSPAVGLTKIKKIKPSANPRQYVAFSKLLPKTEQFHHAVDRLTFGPRPGDLERIERIGLQKWLELQLNPEKIPEALSLERRLEPLESLRMSIHDTYLRYPPPQMIAAVARGQAPLPEDPELRTIVVRLADRYLKKREAATQPSPSLQQPPSFLRRI